MDLISNGLDREAGALATKAFQAQIRRHTRSEIRQQAADVVLRLEKANEDEKPFEYDISVLCIILLNTQKREGKVYVYAGR